MYAQRWLYACSKCCAEKFLNPEQVKYAQWCSCPACNAPTSVEAVSDDPMEVKASIDDYDDLVEAMGEEGCTVDVVSGTMWSDEDKEFLPLALVSGPDTMSLQRVSDAPQKRAATAFFLEREIHNTRRIH